MTEQSLDVTGLIQRAAQGDADAADRLFAVTYNDLIRLARRRLAGGGRNTVLDTASLVHESYLRFANAGPCASSTCIIFSAGPAASCDRSSSTWPGADRRSAAAVRMRA